jgi:NAD(P)-dependent dehydrogenase (short-subunit alcohol dehydrogenase family)
VSQRQVVMITGASAGVGRATAIAFAKRGARIGLLARGRAGLEAARRDVLAAGGEALICIADVSNAEQVEAAAAALEREFGPIDVWVNNAMNSVFSPIIEMTPEDYKRVTEVTYLGFVYGSLSALRRMRPRNRGVIVQVGSALAYRGIPLQSAYCAAKHAIEGFCDSLRTELLHERSRIRVTMVQLPAINTPQFNWVKSRLRGRAQPVPPIFQPEVAADAILWAADHHRAEIYLGWPTVKAIVANKILPQRVDKYLATHGYDSQQANEPESENRPHNLYTPLDDAEDAGAHGRFDDQARDFSWQFLFSRYRTPIALAALTLAGVALARGSRGSITGFPTQGSLR